MVLRNIVLCVVVICLFKVVSAYEFKKLESSETGVQREREGKVFSLFSVVSFANNECRSSNTRAGVGRNGTCFTAAECLEKQGAASGKCAAGFGVCCVFMFTESGATVNQNCTYLQNPGFPSAFLPITTVTYTINKIQSDVCHLRLDFETFNIRGMSDSTELPAITCTDKFTIEATSVTRDFPTICGLNTGMHCKPGTVFRPSLLYVDFDRSDGDTVKLNFNFGPDAAGTSIKLWDIKASQIRCGAEEAPPCGCLQYFQGATGTIKTFNFDAVEESHLQNQDYSICFRREAGYCCIRYTVCNEQNSFTLYAGDTVITTALTDTECSLDYVRISGGTSVCTAGATGLELRDRFCGLFFNTRSKGAADATLLANAPICDCSAPFSVDIITDATADLAAGNDRIGSSKGLCLDFSQVPC